MWPADKREEKKAKTHDEIINSAADLIRKDGISGASVACVYFAWTQKETA